MQKLLRPIHREISLNAKCASDVYTSSVSNNRLVLDTTMDAQGLTAAGANVLLHKRVLFPSKRAANFNFDKTAEEQRGVRLIDGDDKDRAVVETEEDDDNLADFGADAEDDDDAAAEDGEADV